MIWDMIARRTGWKRGLTVLQHREGYIVAGGALSVIIEVVVLEVVCHHNT